MSFDPFLGVLLALTESSSDTSPLPVCFTFFLDSPLFLLLPPLEATVLAGGFLVFGDGPLACEIEQLVHKIFKIVEP